MKLLIVDPGYHSVNESQPSGAPPDFEELEEEPLPLGDREPGVAEAKLAVLDKPYGSGFSAGEAS